MGGKSSKEVTTTDITNEMNTEIENQNIIMTEILNKTMTESTMNVVSENVQQLMNTTGGNNTLNLGNINATGNAQFTVNQKIDINATNTAVANLMQDAAGISSLAEKLNTSVMDKINNDAEMTKAMETTATVKDEKEKAGGIADMLSSVVSAMESVLTPGTKSTKENRTTIKTAMNMNIKNINRNESKIQNDVKNTMTNNITQKNLSSCVNETIANNVINAGDVNLSGNAQVELNQISSVTALSSCVIGAAQTSKLLSDITSGISVDSSKTTENTTKDDSGVKVTAEVVKSDVTKAAFENMITSLGTGSLLLLGGGYILFTILLIAGLYFAYQALASGKLDGVIDAAAKKI